MRVCGCLVLFLGSLQLASASQWADPEPCEAVSEDGRYYLQLTLSDNEDAFREAKFTLVERRLGSPAKLHCTGSALATAFDPTDYAWSNTEGRMVRVKTLTPDPGDRVLAVGTCWYPVAVACLDAGAGFILLSRYGGTSDWRPEFARYDGEGKEVWSKTLAEVVPKSMFARLVKTSSGYQWLYASWVAGEHVILVCVGEHGRPELLRVHVDTGETSEGTPEDLLSRIAPHSSRAKETEVAAWAALVHQSPQAREAAQRTWDAGVSEPTRARIGLLLAAFGNGEARAYVHGVLERTAEAEGKWPDDEQTALRYLLHNLYYALGEQAVDPLLRVSRTRFARGAFLGLWNARRVGMKAAVEEASARRTPKNPVDVLWSMSDTWHWQPLPLAEDLTAALPELNGEARALAMWWLCCFDKDRETLPVLKAAAEEPNPAVRAAAIAAIVRVDLAEARHYARALVDGCESEDYGEVVRPALVQIGEALRGRGESNVWVVLLYWRLELLVGFLSVVVWYGLAARFWAGPGLRRFKLLGMSTLVALPPAATSCWAILFVCNQPWVRGFLPERSIYSQVPLPILATLSFSMLFVLVALAVCARKPRQPRAALRKTA